jgi:N-acetylneuraminic acid mutarotase
MRFGHLAAVLLLAIGTTVAAGSSQRTLTFEDRVAAQKAIEQVYWNHRIWPKANTGTKPPLAAVLSDVAIRTKVEESLRQSEALTALWSRPVTADQLQAELDRMVAQTHDGATLRELFSALGDDPARIAETLARPALVRRLIHDWYAFDSRFHGDLRARAEAAAAACHAVSCMKTLGGDYRETVWRRGDAATSTPAGPTIVIGADDWTGRLARLARAVGGRPDHLSVLRPGRLDESSEAFTITAVLSQSDSEVRVATTTWAKRPFDTWWAEASQTIAPVIPQAAGDFTIAVPQSTTCTDDAWKAIPNEVPEPRSGHTAVWTGSEMIVWGGESAAGVESTGGRYVPATDTWTFTSTAGAPALTLHTAVWTGTKMIVWGGYSPSVLTGTGGQYDPSTDSWTPTSTKANAPAGRKGHTAVWTGTEMIVWGGDDSAAHLLNSGARYNASTDTWLATSSGANLPRARTGATAVWTGSEMIVWGGRGSAGDTNTGGRYAPSTDSWTATSTGSNVPSGRTLHTAVWTDSVMIVWEESPARAVARSIPVESTTRQPTRGRQPRPEQTCPGPASSTRRCGRERR